MTDQTPAHEGTANIEKVLDVAVEALNDYRSLAPEDSVFTKVSKFMPAFMKGVSAIDAITKVIPESKDLDAAEVEKLVNKYSPLFGVNSPHTGLYVSEGSKIIGSGLRIIAALRS